MTVEQIKAEFNKLPVSEKLLLVEDMWDAIAADESSLPVPDWQREELAKRHKAYEEGDVALRDWQSVHKSIRDKYK